MPTAYPMKDSFRFRDRIYYLKANWSLKKTSVLTIYAIKINSLNQLVLIPILQQLFTPLCSHNTKRIHFIKIWVSTTTPIH